MKNTIHRNYYINMLYMNAARSINDKIFSIAAQSIDYKNLNDVLNSIINNETSFPFFIDDPCCAFFHHLCCILSENIYNNDYIIYIMSPYHHRDVICEMIVPFRNRYFCCTDKADACKDTELYTLDNSEKISDLFSISSEFIEKSTKNSRN